MSLAFLTYADLQEPLNGGVSLSNDLGVALL
jgi:hypothetical protein